MNVFLVLSSILFPLETGNGIQAMYFLRNVLRSISLTLDKGDVEYWKRKLKYDRRKRTQEGQQR